jgi:hypothetical protein
MRTDATPHSNGPFSQILLPGTILLANIDMNGLFAYGLKAALGGAIWLAFKIVADRMEHRKSFKGRKPRFRIIRGRKKGTE